MLKVRNMEGNSGPVANQFIIEGEGKRVFQSYESVCAVWEKKENKLILGQDCLFSRTTAKYLYSFVQNETPIDGFNRKIALKAMDEGKIDLDGFKIEFDENLV